MSWGPLVLLSLALLLRILRISAFLPALLALYEERDCPGTWEAWLVDGGRFCPPPRLDHGAAIRRHRAPEALCLMLDYADLPDEGLRPYRDSEELVSCSHR